MDQWADNYGLPHDIVYGLVWQESSFNPSALGDNGLAFGLTQLHLDAAQSVGYAGDGAGLYDPNTNLRYGLAYLAHQVTRYSGDYNQALSAYNAGTAYSGNAAYVDSVLQHADTFDAGDGDSSDDPTIDGDQTGSATLGIVAAVAAVAVFAGIATIGRRG